MQFQKQLRDELARAMRAAQVAAERVAAADDKVAQDLAIASWVEQCTVVDTLRTLLARDPALSLFAASDQTPLSLVPVLRGLEELREAEWRRIREREVRPTRPCLAAECIPRTRTVDVEALRQEICAFSEQLATEQ